MNFTATYPIPPGSKIKLARYDSNTPDWEKDVGRVFVVGYYNQNDGLDVVWLVNSNGEYEQTTDQDSLRVFFEIIDISDNKDYFGSNVPPGASPSTQQ